MWKLGHGRVDSMYRLDYLYLCNLVARLQRKEAINNVLVMKLNMHLTLHKCHRRGQCPVLLSFLAIYECLCSSLGNDCLIRCSFHL